MRKEHYAEYLAEKFELLVTHETGDRIIEGELLNRETKQRYPIRKGIPRLVESARNYTDTFGFQWNTFKRSQLDSHTKQNLSHDRFYSNTKWTPGELKGKRVLEVGSGAGRFTEILLQANARVVSFDYSSAVESNYESHSGNPNLFLFQGDLYAIPFPDNYFDFVFCYGVLQHTPDPVRSFQCIFEKVKKSGKISIDYYLNPERPTVWTTPKYFWRRLTARMNPKVLLTIIKLYMPLWLPFDSLIKRLPRNLGYRILSRVPIPCYNYLHNGFTYSQRLEWAILDTFDALSAAYDYPKTMSEFEEMIAVVSTTKQDLFYGSNGLVANLIKA